MFLLRRAREAACRSPWAMAVAVAVATVLALPAVVAGALALAPAPRAAPPPPPAPKPVRVDSGHAGWLAPGATFTVTGWAGPGERVTLLARGRPLVTGRSGARGRFRLTAIVPDRLGRA